MARKKRQRRHFTPEYKAEVVELIKTSGKGIAQVARDLDLTETTVRNWVKQAEDAQAEAAGDAGADLVRENAELRKRVRELEMERAILKKAAAFFAKESS